MVRHGTVDDKEDEVVIVVELRSLTKVLGILEGERVELEDITQYSEVLILWCREVYPEEAAAREQTLEIVPNEVQFANLFFMYDMTGRGSRDRLIALSPRAAPPGGRPSA